MASSSSEGPSTLSDDTTHRRSQLAALLLERADALHDSLRLAAEEEMAEWELSHDTYGTRGEDDSTTHHQAPGLFLQPAADPLDHRVRRRAAKDSKLVATAEIGRLKASVAQAKANLAACSNKLKVDTSKRHTLKTTAPRSSAGASTVARPRRFPEDDSRLTAMLRELHKQEAEVAVLRERELALVGVLTMHQGLTISDAHEQSDAARRRR